MTGTGVIRLGVAIVLVVSCLPMLAFFTFALVLLAFDESSGSLVIDGQSREYLLYVPKTIDPNKPSPVVISLHGAALWPSAQRWLSDWDRVADEQGFIVVYPSGAGFPKTWQTSEGTAMDRDIQFIASLIDLLESTYNVDASKIYLNGHSNGGGLTFALSCTLDDRIAAFGIVAGAQTLAWNRCRNSSPAPVMLVHGTEDPIVPFEGGPSGDPLSPREFPNIESWTMKWANRNGCAPEAKEEWVRKDVRRLRYEHCVDDAEVVLYALRKFGHDWPGGKSLPNWLVGPNISDFDATNRMWTFFSKHSLAMR